MEAPLRDLGIPSEDDYFMGNVLGKNAANRRDTVCEQQLLHMPTRECLQLEPRQRGHQAASGEVIDGAFVKASGHDPEAF